MSNGEQEMKGRLSGVCRMLEPNTCYDISNVPMCHQPLTRIPYHSWSGNRAPNHIVSVTVGSRGRQNLGWHCTANLAPHLPASPSTPLSLHKVPMSTLALVLCLKPKLLVRNAVVHV